MAQIRQASTDVGRSQHATIPARPNRMQVIPAAHARRTPQLVETPARTSPWTTQTWDEMPGRIPLPVHRALHRAAVNPVAFTQAKIIYLIAGWIYLIHRGRSVSLTEGDLAVLPAGALAGGEPPSRMEMSLFTSIPGSFNNSSLGQRCQRRWRPCFVQHRVLHRFIDPASMP